MCFIIIENEQCKPSLVRSKNEDLCCTTVDSDKSKSCSDNCDVESYKHDNLSCMQGSSSPVTNGSQGTDNFTFNDGHPSDQQHLSKFHGNDTSSITNRDKLGSPRDCSQIETIPSHNYKVSLLSSNKLSKQCQQTKCQYNENQANLQYSSSFDSHCQTERITRPSQESSNFQNINFFNFPKPVFQQQSGGFAYVSDPRNGTKLQFDQLQDRLKSYVLPPSWVGLVDTQSMAEAGFVYTGQEDLVYCFSCNLKLDGWTKHMDPLLRHKEESPTCSFVRQKLQAIKGEKKKIKSVVAPSKPLNPRQTASIGQLKSQPLHSSTKPAHAVVTGLDEPRSSYASRGGDQFSLGVLPINAENYVSEAERIRSFVGWPLNESVHPEQLARVGFVYTGEGSLVQCFRCGARYRNWLKGDVPLTIHQRCNPRCAFLYSLASKSESLEEQLPSSSFIESGAMLPTAQNENNTLEFPTYEDQATRLQSFKYWGGVLPKEELAEAGFYFVARRDVVRCFSCRVVLQDWERTDNVIEEHQRHSPNCSFLKTHLYNISATSRTSSSINKTLSREKSIELKSRDYQSSQLDTTVTSLSTLDIKQPPSIDDEVQSAGIHYPPSYAYNPPSAMSPPPGSSDSEESTSHLDYKTSLQQQSIDPSTNKQIVVSMQITLDNCILLSFCNQQLSSIFL